MKAIYDVIKRPLLTEKGTTLQEKQGTYIFEVSLDANKIEIRSAIEELFNVKVAEVRTSIAHGKIKRFGRSFGKRSNWKKAYVRLEGDAQLNFLNPGQPAQ